MASIPWSNETERADYYRQRFNEQVIICERLQTEKDDLIRTYAECQKDVIKSFADRFVTELFDGYDLKFLQITNVKRVADKVLKEVLGDEE